MALSPFLIVLAGRDNGSPGIARRRWRNGRDGWVGIRHSHGSVEGNALEDGHESGDDEDNRPTMGPGEDSEGVEEEEDADEDDPDGAAKSAEETELVAGGSVVDEAGA
jgi:hypothetical protein